MKVCPSECAFRIYGKDQPNLRISIAIPFDGMRLLHVDGSEITDRRVIPLGDLPHYRIVSHGKKHRKIKISYTTEKVEDRAEIKQLNGRIISGIVPLSDYYDLIVRMFNLYGVNSFDRTSSVVLNIHGHEVFVRRFVLEANIDGDSVRVDDLLGQTESNYDGTLYAVSVEEPITAECLKPVELIRDEEKANLFHFPEDFGYNEVIVFSGAEYPRRIIPKYFNRNDGEQDKKWRDEHTKQVIQTWTEKLKKEDVLMGEAWKSVCVAFEMCSRHHLPFSTIDAFKAIRNHPDLMVKLILAMWLNNSGEILMQDIEEFEQEMVTALHWIPRSVWDKSIRELIDNSPAPLRSRLSDSLSAFFELLRNLLFSTLSMDEAQDLSIYISSGRIGEGTKISKQEINDFNSTISGVDDANHDLPILWHCIKGSYYHKCDMLDYYRVMLKSAICAAENNGEVDGATDLFSERFKDNGRIINFYRRYFKETYSKIFMRALKIIKNPKK